MLYIFVNYNIHCNILVSEIKKNTILNEWCLLFWCDGHFVMKQKPWHMYKKIRTGFRELLQMRADVFDFLFLSLRVLDSSLAVALLRSRQLILDI